MANGRSRTLPGKQEAIQAGQVDPVLDLRGAWRNPIGGALLDRRLTAEAKEQRETRVEFRGGDHRS